MIKYFTFLILYNNANETNVSHFKIKMVEKNMLMKFIDIQ